MLRRGRRGSAPGRPAPRAARHRSRRRAATAIGRRPGRACRIPRSPVRPGRRRRRRRRARTGRRTAVPHATARTAPASRSSRGGERRGRRRRGRRAQRAAGPAAGQRDGRRRRGRSARACRGSRRRRRWPPTDDAFAEPATSVRCPHRDRGRASPRCPPSRRRGDPAARRTQAPRPRSARRTSTGRNGTGSSALTILAGVSARALADLIQANQPCVALTGAGISTESGIPDFRSATGIWQRFDPYEVASIDAFRRNPERVWEFYALRLDVLAEARPNPAHLALAELEARGLLQAVVTQNVDRLHLAAGSHDVVEVHGSIGGAVCLSCGRRENDVRPLLPVPRCPACGAVLKPGVVMFGELLPPAAIDRATTLAREAALLLVVGTSLEVWPVAGLPEDALANGGKLAIVNREPTPYDGRARIVLHDSAAAVLAACLSALTSSKWRE